MSKLYELPKHTDPIGEASEWLARIDRGLSDEEESALRAWLAAEQENPAALMEAAEIWDKMSTLSRLADLFPKPQRQTANASPFSTEVSSSSRSRRRTFNYALAAVLVTVIVGFWHSFGDQLTVLGQKIAGIETENEPVFQTAVGEHSTVNLSDGSRLTLNSDSLVKVVFSQQRRLILLKRGEVYVQVAHDESRPLSVQVGDNKFVEAVGTAFNVKITQDQRIELIVTEGKVLVGVSDKQETIPSPSKRPKSASGVSESRVSVSAGEQMLLGDDHGEVKSIEPEEINVRLSWRGGNLIFRGESLEQALAEIERYTPIEFVIQDKSLKKIRVVGLFKAGDVDGLLATLRENFDISYERVNDKKVILTSALPK